MLSGLTHPHSQTAEECLITLGAADSGLTSDDATQRLAEYGPNHLPEEPRRPALVRFLLHFHNVLMYVLLGAAAVGVQLSPAGTLPLRPAHALLRRRFGVAIHRE